MESVKIKDVHGLNKYLKAEDSEFEIVNITESEIYLKAVK